MLLTTDRLIIRPVELNDWKRLKEIWIDFTASEYAQYDMPHATDDERAFARVSRWAACTGVDHMFFAVCLDTTVIGYIAFNKRENSHEIGYCFHSAYHGKGYARESHQALFEYLHTLGITRFTAGTAIQNTPSIALLKSLGFTLTGREKVSFYKDMDGSDIVFDGGIFELNNQI